MKHRKLLTEICMTFFISTACIGIAMGVMGSIFLPGQSFGFEAFFWPPVWGLIATILGIVTYSDKELTIRQLRIREVLHLLGIEGIVLGLNLASGADYSPLLWAVIALSVLIIYLTVGLVLWLNDRKNAREFNLYLKKFQEKMRETE